MTTEVDQGRCHHGWSRPARGWAAGPRPGARCPGPRAAPGGRRTPGRPGGRLRRRAGPGRGARSPGHLADRRRHRATAGAAGSGPPTWSPGQPPAASGPAFPGTSHPGEAPVVRQRSGWLPRAALLLALLLVLVSGVQAYQIHVLNDRLGDTRRDLATAQDRDGVRLDGVE
ncbi:hypothetical protein [Micromonospora sagamiensis]|uniref:hypothetical protein n=1 Tax=Micromonospora sagamiensis TaxID=47875 RepID=UPI001FCFDDDC|nr:hypothetical protein [Micromonospora sagamiensis]